MRQIKVRRKKIKEGKRRKREGGCPLCGSDQLRRVYTHATGLPLVRCGRCGLMFFLFPEGDQGPDYWRTGGSRYNIEVYSDPAVIKEVRQAYSHYLGWLEAETGIGKLIDYGCGIGTFIESARSRGWEAYGLDISGVAVKHARARGLPVWTLDEWGAMKSPAIGEADVVTMLDVIEHVEDPPKTLQFVSSLLRDEGILLVETPSADYPFRRLSLWLARLSQRRIDLARFFFYPDHRFYFTPKTLRELLENYGFQVLWARRATTPRAKIMQKLQKVHQASFLTQALAWLALQVTRLLGGNKIIVCARKEPVESQELYHRESTGLKDLGLQTQDSP